MKLKKLLKMVPNELKNEFIQYCFIMIENCGFYIMLKNNPNVSKKEIEKRFILFTNKITEFISTILLKDKELLIRLQKGFLETDCETKNKWKEWIPIFLEKEKKTKKPAENNNYYT